MQQLNLTSIYKQAKGGSTTPTVPTFTPGYLPEEKRNRGAFFWDGGESNEADGGQMLGKKSAVKTGTIALNLFSAPTTKSDQVKKPHKGKATPLAINISTEKANLIESIGTKRAVDDILVESTGNKRMKMDGLSQTQDVEVKT